MNTREKTVFSEKNRLESEKNKEKKIMQYLKNQTKDQISDKDVKYLILDLCQEADNSNPYKKRNEENYIKDLIEILRVKENKITSCITELEEIQKNDENTMKEFIIIRKDKNKESKLNIQKEKQKERKILVF